MTTGHVPALMNFKQTARYLGVGLTTVYRMRSLYRLPLVEVTPGNYMVNRAVLDAQLNKATVIGREATIAANDRRRKEPRHV